MFFVNICDCSRNLLRETLDLSHNLDDRILEGRANTKLLFPTRMRTCTPKCLCSPECARAHAYPDAHAHPNVQPHMLTKVFVLTRVHKNTSLPKCPRPPQCPTAHAHKSVLCSPECTRAHAYQSAHAHPSAQSPCKEWPGPPPICIVLFAFSGLLLIILHKKRQVSYHAADSAAVFLSLERGGGHWLQGRCLKCTSNF